MCILKDILGWLLTKKREQVVDKRETIKTLADELDKLADLMSNVLNVTSLDGYIQQNKLPELEIVRQQVWVRWISILGTSGYASQDPHIQEEIEKCIKIAHAAPGAYVEEIFLIQMDLSKGRISQENRERFSRSINSIRDLTTRMRLNA